MLALGLKKIPKGLRFTYELKVLERGDPDLLYSLKLELPKTRRINFIHRNGSSEKPLLALLLKLGLIFPILPLFPYITLRRKPSKAKDVACHTNHSF
jgi:hypothetical protein